MDPVMEQIEKIERTAREAQRVSEGQLSITETCASVAKTLRGAIPDYEWLQGPSQEAVHARYAFTFGALLAFVAAEPKAELTALVHSGLPPDDGRPAGMLGGPFTAPEDPEYRYGA
jgi:hypothetical protein